MKIRTLILALVCTVAVMNIQAQQAFKVKVTGKGNPILLFPGFGCPGEIWDETTKELSKQYECHVFTFAGFGNVPSIGKPWLPKIKDQVVDYVNRLHLQQPVIIGHSLGGTLGLWLAATETSLFKKIIVVDALPCTGALMMPNFKAADMQYDNPYSRQLLQMDSMHFRSQVKQQVSYMMLNKEKQDEVVNWMMIADRETYVYGYVDMLRLDLSEDLANIKIPVVILAATFPDRALFEKTYLEQYKKSPDITFHYADKAAHFVMLDQPEWFLTKLKENIQ